MSDTIVTPLPPVFVLADRDLSNLAAQVLAEMIARRLLSVQVSGIEETYEARRTHMTLSRHEHEVQVNVWPSRRGEPEPHGRGVVIPYRRP